MKVKDFLEMLNEHDPEMDIINPIVGITEVIIVHHTGEVLTAYENPTKSKEIG